jgi:predicted Zn-dependent peptidase
VTVAMSRLPGGLTVASDRMDRVETVSIGAWVNVGTRHEDAGVNGIAHLLEHMAFKGTARRSAYDIAEEMEAVGGFLNAYTSRESTAYYAKALAEDAPLAIDIISDILRNPLFDSEELARERDVVLQEIGQSFDTPDDIVFEHFQAAAYPDQPLGRPVLGSAEIVGRLDQAALRGYLNRHYGPRRIVVAAAGRIEHDRLVDLAGEGFEGMTQDSADAPQPAVYHGGDYREMRDLEQLHFLLGFESLGVLDPDYYALNLLSTLFGGGMSSRLFQEVREKRGLVYAIYAFNSSFLDSGFFGIYAGTGDAQAGELVAVICDEVMKLTQEITEAELARAATQLKASIRMGRESTSTRAEQLAQQIMVHGRPLEVAEILEKIDAVGVADVMRLARRMIAGTPTVAALGPIGRLDSFERIAERLA